MPQRSQWAKSVPEAVRPPMRPFERVSCQGRMAVTMPEGIVGRSPPAAER